MKNFMLMAFCIGLLISCQNEVEVKKGQKSDSSSGSSSAPAGKISGVIGG